MLGSGHQDVGVQFADLCRYHRSKACQAVPQHQHYVEQPLMPAGNQLVCPILARCDSLVADGNNEGRGLLTVRAVSDLGLFGKLVATTVSLCAVCGHVCSS